MRYIRIWGSFGQKLLEETKIVIVSPSGRVDKVIERAIVLLKMSGMSHFVISRTMSIVEDAVLIIDYSNYNQIPEILNDLNCSVALIYGNLSFKSIFSKRICKIKWDLFSFHNCLFLVIDANRKEMNVEDLRNLLKIIYSLKENKDLKDFCWILNQFIEENDRIVSLPHDLEYFLKRSSLNIDVLIYLIENCTKFVLLEGEIDETILDLESIQSNQNILNEFKFAAILAEEIQKLITRKYLPEVKTITITIQ